MSDTGTDWPFDQPKNGAAVTLRSIIFGGAPILHVSHDEDDHGWQFVDGGNVDAANAAIVAMEEIVDRDASVIEVADLPPGWIARRERVGAEWKRQPLGG